MALNPNADPFLYTTPFHPPPKLDFAPVPIPIFNLSHPFKSPPHLRQLPLAPSRVVLAPPVHGYGSFVDPFPHQHQHPMFGFYDVVPQVPSWPCLGGGVSLSHHPENSGGNGEMKSQRKCKIRKWVPQVQVRVRDETPLPFPSAVDLMPVETTTVMIKNIPNQLRRHNLLNILDEHCKWKNLNSSNHNNNKSFDSRRSEYDFVYLPMDFRKYWYDGKISNLGYAFVNFTSSIAASEFCKAYHRRQWEVSVNRKVCEIKRAKVQGLKDLMEAFRNKIFWCHANNYLPVVLEPPSDGCRRYRVTPVGKRIGRPPPNPIKKCG